MLQNKTKTPNYFYAFQLIFEPVMLFCDCCNIFIGNSIDLKFWEITVFDALFSMKWFSKTFDEWCEIVRWCMRYFGFSRENFGNITYINGDFTCPHSWNIFENHFNEKSTSKIVNSKNFKSIYFLEKMLQKSQNSMTGLDPKCDKNSQFFLFFQLIFYPSHTVL